MVNIALIKFTVVISVSDSFTRIPVELTWREAEDFLVGECRFRCQAGRQADLQQIRTRTIGHGLLSWGTMWRPVMRGGG